MLGGEQWEEVRRRTPRDLERKCELQHQTNQIAMETHAHANMAGHLMTSLMMSELSLCVALYSSLQFLSSTFFSFCVREKEGKDSERKMGVEVSGRGQDITMYEILLFMR